VARAAAVSKSWDDLNCGAVVALDAFDRVHGFTLAQGSDSRGRPRGGELVTKSALSPTNVELIVLRSTDCEIILGRPCEGEVVRENLLAVHHEVCHGKTIAQGADNRGRPAQPLSYDLTNLSHNPARNFQ
jgi:hypothetical protein